METVDMEIVVKGRVRGIQSAMRRLTGNTGYQISDDTGLYSAIHTLLSKMRLGNLLREWWISSERRTRDYEDTVVELNMHFTDPVDGWQSAKNLETYIAA